MNLRDAYLTAKNHDRISVELLQEVYGSYKNRPAIPDLKFTSLIILDMQEYFLNESSHAYIPSARNIVNPICELSGILASSGRPVVKTRHTNNAANSRMMANWWGDLIEENNSSSRLIPEIESLNAQIVLKHQYDAFFETELDELLKEGNCKSVIITGVMTHLCCETTARSAFVRGYEVFFPVDATATYNLDHHLATLKNLAHGFAHIMSVSQLISGIRDQQQ